MAQSNGDTALRRNSLVDLSLVIAAGGALLGGTAWATKMNVGQEALRQEVRASNEERREQYLELRQLIAEGSEDRWTLSMMVRLIQRANREAEVYAEDIRRAIKEDGAVPLYVFPDPREIAGSNH